MPDGIAVECSRAGAVRQNMFVCLRLAAGAERARGILRSIPALQIRCGRLYLEKSFPRKIKKMCRKVVPCRYPQFDVFSGHGFGETLGLRPLEL